MTSLPLMVDEDFDQRVLRGVRLREPSIDIRTPSELGMLGKRDEEHLVLAAELGRVFLSFDKATVTEAAYRRIVAGLECPGVFIVKEGVSFRRAIEEILLLAFCELPSNCVDQVRYIP